MPRTDSAVQLAAIYTSADVFFNPTVEDNYPTVNLEAESCGTPVVTYNTGGCRETLRMPRSSCLGGFDESLSRIITLAHSPRERTVVVTNEAKSILK